MPDTRNSMLPKQIKFFVNDKEEAPERQTTLNSLYSVHADTPTLRNSRYTLSENL